MNPRAVNASREQQASTSGAPITALAPAASQTDPKTGISFAKAFTPQERTAQRAALLQKLQEMDAEDAQKSTGPTPSN